MFEKKMTVQLSEDDYVHFNSYHLKNHPAGKKVFAVQLVVMPIVCVLALILVWVLSEDLFLLTAEIVALSIVCVLWEIFAKKRLLKQVRKGYRKALKKDPSFAAPSVMTFTEDYFVEEGKNETSSLHYAALKHIGMDEQGVYLYKNDILAYVLPNRCFCSAQDKEEFTEFVKRKAQEQKNGEITDEKQA
ncbi:MAG: YcxB family protein [Clostridia bacterium]|nr:YcxB family protein [Clostridia bacterium]